MPVITLADGSNRSYDSSLTVLDLAHSISRSIAKKTVSAYVDDKLVDLSYVLATDAQVKLITSDDQDGLEVLRHSCAHLLAMAVKELYPSTKLAIGPVIADGFYYDFATDQPISIEDLKKIEKKMHSLAAHNYAIERKELSLDRARELFASNNEDYKLKILEDLSDNEQISCYQQGNFIDLCRGPHVSSTSKLAHFKLTKIAGAYWRGDSDNEMLQRIYGTCWFNKSDLAAYLLRLEEAAKRDHRKIGKQLSWFHTQEEAPGIVFWHPGGFSIYHTIESYLREILVKYDYHEIKTPQILDRSLWERSGHWDKFNDMMFTTNSENRNYAVKPMNCPGHVQIFNQGIKSYKDLPLRLSEFGSCHRNEPSGTLHGLMRVRAFTQDDAHIFCTPEQIQTEVSNFIDLVYKVYADFGFSDILLKLSTRPEQRVGSDAVWDEAEQALEQALDAKQLAWELLPGEGAFYGPKIEFSLKDCLGRIWQCGTIQVDFSMPQRLDATYIDAGGNKQTPVMLHRAILGSFERFIGIVIEHYAGCLPCWLAPTQLAILSITDKQHQFCQQIAQIFKDNNLRATIDLRNEKINFKIRHHSIAKVPYLLIIGDKEVADNSVSVRTRAGKDLGSYTVDDFVAKMRTMVADKILEEIKY
jgi:threonyl-tRNA synthetase